MMNDNQTINETHSEAPIIPKKQLIKALKDTKNGKATGPMTLV